MLREILCERINPGSGVIQFDHMQDRNEIPILLDIVWKGGIHFIVAGHSDGGWYYVERDRQYISELYRFRKIDDMLCIRMQRMINEIESGKYRSKKTLSEKILSTVEQKGFVSYMNHTKWRELINAIKEQIPDILIKYKTIFEDEAPGVWWTIGGDEYFEYMNTAQIEWFKMKYIIKDTIWTGRLVPPRQQISDRADELLRIFQKYHLAYEHDKEEQAFVVYGYK